MAFQTQIKSITLSNNEHPWAKVFQSHWVVENGRDVNASFGLAGRNNTAKTVTYTRRGTNTGFKIT